MGVLAASQNPSAEFEGPLRGGAGERGERVGRGKGKGRKGQEKTLPSRNINQVTTSNSGEMVVERMILVR